MNRLIVAFVVLLAAMPAWSQSSTNTFSPYTFWGLGDLAQQGTGNQRSMGGAGVASRGVMNTLNPASLSALERKTFNFDFGIEGGMYYLKEGAKKTSYNTFNIKDLVFRMPLGKRLGFGASLTPFSNVGYRVKESETDPAKLADAYQNGAFGIDYLWQGSGDMAQMKFSLGWEPVKRLSLGVDMLYYFGEINRSYASQFLSRESHTGITNPSITQNERISRIRWGFGAQYNILEQNRRWLTVGATYLLETSLNPDINVLASNSTGSAQVLSNGLLTRFKLPETFAAGVFYQTWRLQAGIDFERQNWAKANPNAGELQLRNTNQVRAGVEFTPARYDVRYPFRRVSYRLGVRRGDYYMKFGGHNIVDKAITVGFGIPFKVDRQSYLDLGLELGQRGSAAVVRETYFKISVGFRLNSSGWFQKMMYM